MEDETTISSVLAVVLVVGAGPGGAPLASILAIHGLACSYLNTFGEVLLRSTLY